MHSNYFDSMILGFNNFGQGFVNAVEGTHRAALRAIVSIARRLSLRLGAWRALSMKRMPATMTPAAMCPSFSASRRQRQQRWQPGVVVVDAGTVGVC
jgi:hypothetical protein